MPCLRAAGRWSSFGRFHHCITAVGLSAGKTLAYLLPALTLAVARAEAEWAAATRKTAGQAGSVQVRLLLLVLRVQLREQLVLVLACNRVGRLPGAWPMGDHGRCWLRLRLVPAGSEAHLLRGASRDWLRLIRTACVPCKQVIVVAPSRELAMQIVRVAQVR